MIDLQSKITKIKQIQGMKLLRLLAIFFITFLLIVIIVLILLKSLDKEKSVVTTKELPSVKIAPNMLWLAEEPLDLPPIQFSREQKKIWTDFEVEEFFKSPSDKILFELNDSNTKKVKKLLEDVE